MLYSARRTALPRSADVESMPGANQPNTDRNLLFGILAWQNGLLTETQLLAAMKEWSFQKTEAIGAILVRQRVLSASVHAKLDEMVDLHVGLHSDDATKSLAAVSSAAVVMDALADLGDTDIKASLRHVRQISAVHHH